MVIGHTNNLTFQLMHNKHNSPEKKPENNEPFSPKSYHRNFFSETNFKFITSIRDINLYSKVHIPLSLVFSIIYINITCIPCSNSYIQFIFLKDIFIDSVELINTLTDKVCLGFTSI